MPKPKSTPAAPVEPAPAAEPAAVPSQDQILDQLTVPDAPETSRSGEEATQDVANGPEGTDAPEAGAEETNEPDTRDQRIAELEAAQAELEAKLTAAQAASSPTLSQDPIFTKSVEEIRAVEREIRAKVNRVNDLIDAGEDYTDDDGNVIYTRKQLIEGRRVLRDQLDDLIPAALETAKARTSTAAQVRKDFPVQFTPNTPAAKTRATVARELAGLAAHPQYERIVAEITEYRLSKAAAPKPAGRAPNLPAGTAGKRNDATPKREDPNLRFLKAGTGEDAFIQAFGGG